MEVRPGYKRTDVGVIPEEWEVNKLGEIGSFKKGRTILKSQLSRVGKPCVLYGEIYTRYDYVVKELIARIPDEVAERSTSIQPGDILFAGSGETAEEIGKCFAYAGAQDAYAGGDLIILCPEEDDSIFLGYQLNSALVRQQKETRGQGSSVVHIYVSGLSTIDVPMPPLPEQRAIAEVLSAVDALIAALDRLIAKKRAIKQGAMQELLTGKTRLPGFSGAWEVKRLDEVAEIRNGGTPSTSQTEFWGGGIMWCTPSDISALEGGKYLSETARKITAQGLNSSSAELIPPCSVVMTSRATIGACAINTIPVATNQGFKSFVTLPGFDAEFLYYLLQTKTQEFISLCGGSTFLEIGKSQLSSFEIEAPRGESEQRAIAALLSDMDAEIAALEARRDKTRALKQGMMQELLTGRTRLV